jgi:pyruvate-formate lyase-activating enzyme
MPHAELHAVFADETGNVYDDPDMLMVCRRGDEWALPRPDETIPMPLGSELFLLPGRTAVGLDPETGETVTLEGTAVAAFVAPGHTLSAHPAYETPKDAPILPLFAYGAIGFSGGRFHVCARKVDPEPRQVFTPAHTARIERDVPAMLRTHGGNRLIAHVLRNCVLRWQCPAARNFVLGRYEAPIPTSRTCNARCLGCISRLEPDSPLPATPQCRLDFVPTPEEIVELMEMHAKRETRTPVLSFGQGCEGDPLANWQLLEESVTLYRTRGGPGTVNCNTNASRPEAVVPLARAGLTSMRVSMNSAMETRYTHYHRPQGYAFADVRKSMILARQEGLFVAINLLYFPGITDTEEELEALARLVTDTGASMIQWRNLNIDPDWYLASMAETGPPGPSMGLARFMKRLRRACPWLLNGYFNPYLGERAKLASPMPDAGDGPA